MGQVSLLEVQAAEAALVAQTAQMEAHRKEMRLLLETVAQEELTAVAVGIEGPETITHGTHQPRSLT
jgi:hypothetical protein